MVIGVIKPAGPTSFDIVYKVRKIAGIKTVGHAGTLDPLASGVLVVAIGRDSTKKIETLMTGQKEYIATITLGKNSTTDDEEGEKTEVEVKAIPTKESIESVLSQFVGTIEQVPPLFSAIKVKGRRLYDYARKGRSVELKPRIVTIESIKLISYAWPELVISVVTHKGVYIRSLARDIGEKLRVGGYIHALDRTRVGNFDYGNSMPMEDLKETLPSLIKKFQEL